MTPPLLTVEDLGVEFRTRGGIVRAVDGLSYTVGAGETLAVVGESGSGKSVGALAIMRLIAEPPGRITSGRVRLGDVDLLTLPERRMRRVRGNDISMIFQEPMTSLNPVHTVSRQIAEAVRLHRGVGRTEARGRALEMLRMVQIPEAERRLDQYPHELSGGMRQRVMIAMALACDPKLLIADEPTTALDVTIQAQILEILRDMKRRLGTAIVLITHDLGVVAEMADRVVVMYAGRKVEEGPVRDILRAPRHPYTLGLLRSMPRLGAASRGTAPRRLLEVPGIVPSLREPILGCAFAPRCALAVDRCRRDAPPLADEGPGREAACWRSRDVADIEAGVGP
ncbi:MAG: ABC transporter ATP-binding protein [Rhodospirillales bacterium]|jgi:peptide/nickel transport system ATP-binding protein